MFGRLGLILLVCGALVAVPAKAQRRGGPAGKKAAELLGDSGPSTVAEAEKVLGAMRQVQGQIAKGVDEARASRDVLRFNCIEEKQGLVSALLAMSEGVVQDLKSNAKTPPEIVEHELARISTARAKVASYAAEAEQCIGSVAFRDEEDKETERDFHDSSAEPRDDDPMESEPVESPGYRPPPASPVN